LGCHPVGVGIETATFELIRPGVYRIDYHASLSTRAVDVFVIAYPDRLESAKPLLTGHTPMDSIGHPHDDQLHLTQRFTRTDLGHISYEMLVEDPKTYTKPWKNTRS
jgi:hypothetical protein